LTSRQVLARLRWRSAAGFRRQRLVEIDRGQLQLGPVIGFGKGDAVQPDLDFHQLAGTVRRAPPIFARLDPPAGVGNVGILPAQSLAEQVHASARAGRFDHRRRHTRIGGDELFGDQGGEGIDGRGPDHADAVASGTRHRRLVLTRR